MNEKALIQEIVQSILHAARTSSANPLRIRVVNLTVYDNAIDPSELTRAFESLTSNTIARGAHLHVRRGDTGMKDSSVDPHAVCNLIRLDSFEMEKPAMQMQ